MGQEGGETSETFKAVVRGGEKEREETIRHIQTYQWSYQ